MKIKPLVLKLFIISLSACDNETAKGKSLEAQQKMQDAIDKAAD